MHINNYGKNKYRKWRRPGMDHSLCTYAKFSEKLVIQDINPFKFGAVFHI